MGIVVKALWLAAAAVLSVQPAAQTPPKDVIEGDVVDASTGKGIKGARVRLKPVFEDPLFATTDEQGHFRFTVLPLSSYQVEARYPGFADSEELGVSRAPARQGGPIRIEMKRFSAITGKVTDASGIPVERVQVEVLLRYPAGERHSMRGHRYEEGGYEYGGQRSAWTNDLGEYRIAPLAAGSYYAAVYPTMSPWPRDDTERTTFHPRVLKLSEAKPVDVAEGKSLRLDLLLIRQGGVKAAGRIIGLPPGGDAHPLVLAWSLSSSVWSRGVLGSITGDRFQIADLLPGRYVLEATTHDPIGETTTSAARRIADVGTEDVDGIDLTLAPTPDLEGAVAFEDGCPIAPVTIQLQNDSHSHSLYNLRAGPDGRFVVHHLLPAKYKVYVRTEGFTGARAKSARVGDAEVLENGFDVTPETTGPLNITMGCARR